MRLRIQIPAVQPTEYQPWPKECPRCHGQTFHSHAWRGKALRDTRVDQVVVHRIRCTTCGKTFSVYPQGVTDRSQSERVRALSVFLWLLGVSYRGVSDALGGLQACLGKSQIYDNVQALGEKARQWQEKRLSGRKVRVLGADCTHARINGHDTVVLNLSEGEKGLSLAIEIVEGESKDGLGEIIQEVARAVGAQVLLSDDADVYKEIADELGLEHQVCQQHVVPNTLTLLAQIAGQVEKRLDSDKPPGEEEERMRQALDDLAELEFLVLGRCPASQQRLDFLARRYEREEAPRKGQRATPFYRLKLLTMDLAADWGRLTLTERCRDETGGRIVSATNNVSERSIGMNIKERYRTMRGYKSETSLRRVATLTAYLREEGAQDLISLMAA